MVGAGGTTLTVYSNGNYYNEVAWQGGTSIGSCSKNNGGSGGGVSAYYAQPSYQKGLGGSKRLVPDISLNANSGQNYYFNGALRGVGGTSIVAPELAGFFAQENAYLLYIGDLIGAHCGAGSSVCSPMGNVNYPLYKEGLNPHYAAHYPYYDITSDCNSNDVTVLDHLTSYCANAGYDRVTGWGSANMLQLAWAINTYMAADFGAPKATFTGAAVNTWHHTAVAVSWSLADTTNSNYPKNGVAGYTALWDQDPGDPYRELTPGAGNSYYSGPQTIASAGSINISKAGQGCHTVNLRAWDNAGQGSADLKYGPVCFDNILPLTSIATSVLARNGAVRVTLTGSDPGDKGTTSGVKAIYYSVDSTACSATDVGRCKLYDGPFTIAAPGKHIVRYFSEDRAGNFAVEHALTVVAGLRKVE